MTFVHDEVRRRGLSWFHLPIVDVSTPDGEFEHGWKSVGEDLRSMLKNGADVLVHCRGGLGRAGTIAARLLVQLEMEPKKGHRYGSATHAKDVDIIDKVLESRAARKDVSIREAVAAPRIVLFWLCGLKGPKELWQGRDQPPHSVVVYICLASSRAL